MLNFLSCECFLIKCCKCDRSSGASTWIVQTENKKPDGIFCLQRRTKQKVVTDFATVSKGPPAGAKPRAALRQVLFSQGVPEKTPASEVLCCLLLITLHADMLRNRYRLALTMSAHSNNPKTKTAALLVLLRWHTYERHVWPQVFTTTVSDCLPLRSNWFIMRSKFPIYPLWLLWFFFLSFNRLIFVLPVFNNLSGARSAGCVEAGAGGLRCAGQSKVDVEGGKSGNHAREELDRYSALSFSTSPLMINSVSLIVNKSLEKTETKQTNMQNARSKMSI